MNRDVVAVQVRAVLPLEGSFAVFLGTAEKTFVIYMDESVGTAISMFMRGVPKDRPQTHDLFGHALMAFGAKVDRVVINSMQGSIFFARLILSAENQLHNRKVVELDARPSDSIALATSAGAPIFVARDVWEQVEDVTETLAQIESQGVGSAGLLKSGVPDEDDDEDDNDEDDDDEDDEDDDDFLGLDDDLFEDLGEEGEGDVLGEDDPEADDDDFPFDDEGEEWKKS